MLIWISVLGGYMEVAGNLPELVLNGETQALERCPCRLIPS